MAAQKQEAALLVVVYNTTTIERAPTLNGSDDTNTPITIPVIYIGNDSGQQLKVTATGGR